MTTHLKKGDRIKGEKIGVKLEKSMFLNLALKLHAIKLKGLYLKIMPNVKLKSKTNTTLNSKPIIMHYS